MAGADRRWPRIDLALDVTLRVGDVEEAARTLNISREGLFVATAAPRRVGTRVRVCLALDNGERFHAEGMVIHAQPDPEDPARSDDGRPRGMGIFLTATTLGWRKLCDRLGRLREAKEVRPSPGPRRGPE
ncbi:MAG TPA: PilZ domain-containing protein [Polyangia bacterium]